MGYDVIYSTEYIMITNRPDGIYIESFKKGMTLEDFAVWLKNHGEIKITSFTVIRNALLMAPKMPMKFAELKGRVNVEVSPDELKAFITLSAGTDEFTGDKRANLIKEILKRLGENGIVFGLIQNVFLNELCNEKQILIAKGVPPENGRDSVIRMYELKEAKPEVKEDGNVDHYELNLINTVRKGDWLGERLDPTPGTPGKSVKGNTILPMSGKLYPLFYDRETIEEAYVNGVTTLYSLKDGAVHYDGDRISVSNHLEITQDVDFKTGNIDFDGYLTVKGSVEDNFSVCANKDVELLGTYGIGSVREIVSREGSIFIKGGIAGKSRAIIKLKKRHLHQVCIRRDYIV